MSDNNENASAENMDKDKTGIIANICGFLNRKTFSSGQQLLPSFV